MKKFLTACLLCLIMIFSFVSCHSQTEDTATANQNEYLFAIADNTMYKYNVKSGICSPVCRDPLCRHNDEKCPFYGIGEEIYKLDDSIIYYKENTILTYNLSTNESETAYTASGNIYYPYLIGNVLYFNTVVFDYAPDAEHTATVELYCLDLSDGETEHLNTDRLYDMQRIQGMKGKKIVWYDNGLQSMYVTNVAYEEKEVLNEEYCGIVAGNNSYRLRVVSATPLAFDLYGNQDGKETTVLHNIVSVKGYNDFLFATCNNETGKFIGQMMDDDGTLTDIYEYQSNDIYVYDSCGKNGRKLCSVPDDYIIYSFAPTKITLSNGDYIGVQLKEYEFDAKGYVTGYKASVDIAIVNIKTGDCVISRSK